VVSVSIRTRDNGVGEEPAERLRLAPAEEPLGLGIPRDDPAVAVGGDDRVERILQDEPRALLALAQRLLVAALLLAQALCLDRGADRRPQPREAILEHVVRRALLDERRGLLVADRARHDDERHGAPGPLEVLERPRR